MMRETYYTINFSITHIFFIIVFLFYNIDITDDNVVKLVSLLLKENFNIYIKVEF